MAAAAGSAAAAERIAVLFTEKQSPLVERRRPQVPRRGQGAQEDGQDGTVPRALVRITGLFSRFSRGAPDADFHWPASAPPEFCKNRYQPRPSGSFPYELTPLADWLFFAADDGTHGVGIVENERLTNLACSR